MGKWKCKQKGNRLAGGWRTNGFGFKRMVGLVLWGGASAKYGPVGRYRSTLQQWAVGVFQVSEVCFENRTQRWPTDRQKGRSSLGFPFRVLGCGGAT